ncbi:bifunctional alpha,alpha-trehalose-phosphate synthase (UDP-forming)/trehalose-phosphatase [Persicobacter psychrovividus]|uniref:Bifunctional alpha,alpha-trehalose-phosphate synthase (UDP-forming)/trehalose-phosphatase n=1 Tax=Persicobacter psychrovividus TaxID=387638 RepID=A0ABN6L957_9BACT|nr:bifunctional alpha,alpha-trehalose-phosphate synthase (UDP-forming)/trehalose-phosphatase [Persicobacter psychrovividus]
MSRTIIVSNRLPLKVFRDDNEQLQFATSEGGLATGLGSVYKKGDNLWIGWPGLAVENDNDRKVVDQQLKAGNMRPVYLTEEEVHEFYEGFSNETLWPIFHYFPSYANFDENHWESYKKVNQKFCDAILEIARPDDTIWVHDYQLLLVPQMLRDQLPQISIGFFQHIPFPSFETFRAIPWRRELLMGLMGADLVGFHTFDDMRHFLSSVSRLAGMKVNQTQVVVGNRTVTVDAFPMGIDFEKYEGMASHPDTLSQEVDYRTSIGKTKVMLSIDRLDYSKGIPNRLKAIEMFFDLNPQYIGEVSLFMIVVPSRDTVPKYRALKEEIDLAVGRINAKIGTVNWKPIHYFYRSFDIHSLSAFYRMADVALVTPMRDGMNLVAKEYVASKLDNKGVLILSEMAGASKELSDSIRINPNDIHQLSDAIRDALEMEVEVQQQHMAVMKQTIKRYNIHHWVKLFLEQLEGIKDDQKTAGAKSLKGQLRTDLVHRYHDSNEPMLFLDYDGTLSGFHHDPQKATPDSQLLSLLTKIGNGKGRVVIISGRDRETLGNWLGHLPVDLVAEHGVWYRYQGMEWKKASNMNGQWKEAVGLVMDTFVNRTPGSFIEEKDYSLAWHYRKAEQGFGELRARELVNHLRYITHGMNLQVLEGDMVIEVKSSDVNKGKATNRFLRKFTHDYLFAIGDDWTDEDTFVAIGDKGDTVKVGRASTEATYFVENERAVRRLLEEFQKSASESKSEPKAKEEHS